MLNISFFLIYLVSTLVSKFAHIELHPNWNSTNELAETIEHFKEYHSVILWDYIKCLSNQPLEKLKNLDTKCAQEFLNEFEYKVLFSAIALRKYSPAVAGHQISCKSLNEDCEYIIKYGDFITCDVENFLHVFNESLNDDIVLCTSLYSKSIKTLIDILDKYGDLIVYQNYNIELDDTDNVISLPGYGVEISVKNTEYKSFDSENIKISDDFDSKKWESLKFDDDFEGELPKPEEIEKVDELLIKKLGIQASKYLLESKDFDAAINRSTSLSQNFLLSTQFLTNISISREYMTDYSNIQNYFEDEYFIPSGHSKLFINGLDVNLDKFDLFKMFDLLVSEMKNVDSIFAATNRVNAPNTLIKGYYNFGLENFILDIPQDDVYYFNDIERDYKYASWPDSLHALKNAFFFNQLVPIRKNLINFVFIVDLSNMNEILQVVHFLISSNDPARYGIVFKYDIGDDNQCFIMKVFHKIFTNERHRDPLKPLNFLIELLALLDSNLAKEDALNISSKYMNIADLDVIFKESNKIDESNYKKLHNQYNFIKKIYSHDENVSNVFVNGEKFKNFINIQPKEFSQQIKSKIYKFYNMLMNGIFMGKVETYQSAIDYLNNYKTQIPFINYKLIRNIKTNLKDNQASWFDYDKLPTKYIKKDDDCHLVTMQLFINLDCPIGRQLVFEFLKFLKKSQKCASVIILQSKRYKNFEIALQVVLSNFSDSATKIFLKRVVLEIERIEAIKNDDEKKFIENEKFDSFFVHGMDESLFYKEYEHLKKFKYSKLKMNHDAFIKNLNFDKSKNYIIFNGIIVGPIDASFQFEYDDFQFVKNLVEPMAEKINKILIEEMISNAQRPEYIMKLSTSLLRVNVKNDDLIYSLDRKIINFKNFNHIFRKKCLDPNKSHLKLDIIVNPLSITGQKIIPVMRFFMTIFNFDVTIFFNSDIHISSIPINSFYRYALPSIDFKLNSFKRKPCYVHFSHLPQNNLFTMTIDAPNNWVVESTKTSMDLDNILLSKTLHFGINVIYRLDYLIVEGSCMDVSTDEPPRGLQYTMNLEDESKKMDTIVMANLGYFQFKATPGNWIIQLRQGRSKDIYDIDKVNGKRVSLNKIKVSISSFSCPYLNVNVIKKNNKKHLSLVFEDGEEPEGGFNFSLWNFGYNTHKRQYDQQINVFSLASGQLYERLMRIMILSVLKHTESKVKFWFLRNYLSADFLEHIQTLQKYHDFQYEFVQYKWPSWLKSQSERQRIMWGYKILFLDVLFPLDVHRIIFLDADLILRGDIKELHDMDLGGAVYAYTPFCDSRNNMDNYRFWKSGYWSSHLRNRKYHISALYVIDLDRFRKNAAGDRLRAQYQLLSQDENSLSNLDQDLPNNMIHSIKLMSLPPEWLWCETWCDDTSKQNAKAIDLCNNPKTKENKITAARRIVLEWDDYDKEILKILKGDTESLNKPKSNTLKDNDLDFKNEL
ncbi:UDP-glucose ceramide glucosyltransferase-like 1 [Intoshia linei]|uniref:UDP-glucose ceramide glucosyltransferase-like 1 n=1 Tax=Intoshia linei TaxID=1819745 RepID=A0A177B3H6_9BILA|nr:UDP-glucose ceramide glucosyltransferase-like 1 [Intoshia linei]